MIKLENVSKSYKPGKNVLEDVSFEIKRGEFAFLVGASGSGKSTLLRLLTRQEIANSGNVFVAGKNLNKLKSWRVPSLRRNVGCVFQDFKLLQNKNIYNNVAYALEVVGHKKSHIAQEVPIVLELVGLSHKAKDFPEELSGGEQQRVAIARVFVMRPYILLADEPTGNLDPKTSAGIVKLLERISETGTTVLMATHEKDIVNLMKRRVIELDDGKMTRDVPIGTY